MAESGPQRLVSHLRLEGPDRVAQWWEATGVDDGEKYGPARAVRVDDSGAGSAWLIFGGTWGLRFKPEGSKAAWSLTDKSQWGEPFKVLDISGDDIRFDDARK